MSKKNRKNVSDLVAQEHAARVESHAARIAIELAEPVAPPEPEAPPVAVSPETQVPSTPFENGTPTTATTPGEDSKPWAVGMPHKYGRTDADFILITRTDPIVGRGTCSVIDEAYTDEELLSTIKESLAASGLKLNGFQFIRRARLIHRQWLANQKERQAAAKTGM